MKKRILSVLLAMVLSVAFCTSASATLYTATSLPTLNFNGSTAECQFIHRDYGKDIDVTLELWSGETPIDSWSDSGVSYVSVSGSRTVVRGVTYTVKVNLTVDGESVYVAPISKRCP